MNAIPSEVAPRGAQAESKNRKRPHRWWVPLLAAVMAAFLGLVALPGAANAGTITNARVTLGTAVAGSTTAATVTFVPQTAIPSNGKVLVTFPSGSSPYAVAPTTVTGTGFNAGTTLAIESITQATVTVAATTTGGTDTYTPAAGRVLTITLNGIGLPPNATTGTIGVLESMSTRGSNLATIDTISGSLSFPQIVPGALSGMTLTLSSNAKGATGSATVAFTIANPIPAGGTIMVTLPSGFSGSGSTASGTLVPSAPLCTPSCPATMSGQAITVVIGSSPVARGTSVTLTLSNITNPPGATAGASFIVRTMTATANGVVTNDVDAGQVTGPSIVNASLSGAQVALGTAQAGASTTATTTFTSDDAWPGNGKASITFPTGFCAGTGGSTPTATVKIGAGTATTASVTPSGSCGAAPVTFTVTRPGGSTEAAAGTVVVIAITGVINPTSTGPISYGAGAVKTLASDGATILGSAPSVTAIQSSITGGAITGGAVTASPDTSGATATVSVPFLVTNPVPDGGTILVSFPGDITSVTGTGAYVLTANPWLANLAGLAYSMPASGASCTTTIPSGATTVTGATGTRGTPASTVPFTITVPQGTTIPAGACVVAQVGNVRLPQVSGRAANMTIATRGNSGTLIDTGLASGALTVLPGALSTGPVTLATQASAPDNDAGKAVKVSVTFTLSATNPLPVGGRVTVTFPTSPAAFGFGAVTVDSVSTTVNGTTTPVPGLFSVSSLYTAPELDLNYAGSSPLAPGTTVTVVFAGLTNPTASSVTAGQPNGTPTQWTVSTKTGAILGMLLIDRVTATGPVIVPALAGGPGTTPSGASTGLGSPRMDFATGQAGVAERATIQVKLANPLDAGGSIRVALPADGFDASSAAIPGGAASITAATGGSSTGAFSVTSASASVFVITYAGSATFNDSSTLPAGATIVLPVDGIRLPTTIPAAGQEPSGTTGTKGTTGTTTVRTQTAAGHAQDEGTTATGVLVAPQRATNVTLGVDPAVTGAMASFAVTFTVGTAATVPACPGPVVDLGVSTSGTVMARTACGTVTVTLPPEVTMPATVDTATVTVSVDGGSAQVATAVVKTGASIKLGTPVSLPAGSSVRVLIAASAGVRTPPMGGAYTAKVQTSSAPVDTTGATATIGSPASGVTIQPVGPTLIGQPSGGLVIGFTNGAGAALSIGSGTITLGFPATFPIPATIARQYILVNGVTIPAGAPITASARPSGGQAITFPVPVNIGAGTPVDVAIWAAAGLSVPTHAGPHALTVQTSVAPVDATSSVSFTPEPPTRLLFILPGETAAPGSAPGKIGTPAVASGQSGTITLRAVDRFYNKASSTATVSLTYTDLQTRLPATAAGLNQVTLVAGEATFPVTPARIGNFNLAATDTATSGPLAPAAQAVSVAPGPFTRLVLLLPGETLAPGTATGILGSGVVTVGSAPASIVATIVATDGTYNQTTTGAGYQVTVTGGASPEATTLSNGTGTVTLSMPAGTTTLSLTGSGVNPVTGSRDLTVSIAQPSSGGGQSNGGSSSSDGGTTGSQATPAPTATPSPTPSPTTATAPAPFASPIPSGTEIVPTSQPVAAQPDAPTGASTNGAPPTDSGTPGKPGDAPAGGTGATSGATNGTAPAPPISQDSVPTPIRLTPPRDRSVRLTDLPAFIPETEAISSGARIGFAPGTGATLPPGTMADATALLPAIALALPGVGAPPNNTQPFAAFQTVARDRDGGSTPLTARHLVTLNPSGLLGVAPSGATLDPANVVAFEDRNGTWEPIPTRLDEATGNLIAEATRGLTIFVAFDPATVHPDAEYSIGIAANGEPRARFFTQTNGREPGAIPLGFAVSDTEDGPALRAKLDHLGGTDRLGFPISRETTFKGFRVQVMQRSVLQWIGDPSGNGGQAMQMNVLDELNASGFDDYLHDNLQVPKTFGNEADEGLSMDEVIVRHIGFLADNALTRAAYMENPNHLDDYGLPTAFEEFDDVYVVRTQRAVIQLWKVSRPWAKAGDITVVGAGDLLKDIAHVATSQGDTPPIPMDAFTPQMPPLP